MKTVRDIAARERDRELKHRRKVSSLKIIFSEMFNNDESLYNIAVDYGYFFRHGLFIFIYIHTHVGCAGQSKYFK